MDKTEFLKMLHTAEKLKDTPRHCTTSNRRTESVAEHSWRVALMALLLRSEFHSVDIDKVVAMCLIHDMGECFTGDIPAFEKTDKDRETEDSLLEKWVGSLPKEVSDYLSALYKEMNEQQTTEAKMYKALDKLEAVIQHNESPLDTWAENEFELNKVYGNDAVKFSEWLSDLRKVILNETIAKINSEANGGNTMIKVYCYSRCTTCKKALKWLDDNKIKYELLDIKTDHPDEKTLRKYHKMSGQPLKRFFNTSGTQYRELELSKKLPNMSEDEQFKLLASEGMLVKRPLVVGDKFVLTGFKEDEWKDKLLP